MAFCCKHSALVSLMCPSQRYVLASSGSPAYYDRNSNGVLLFRDVFCSIRECFNIPCDERRGHLFFRKRLCISRLMRYDGRYIGPPIIFDINTFVLYLSMIVQAFRLHKPDLAYSLWLAREKNCWQRFPQRWLVSQAAPCRYRPVPKKFSAVLRLQQLHSSAILPQKFIQLPKLELCFRVNIFHVDGPYIWNTSIYDGNSVI